MYTRPATLDDLPGLKQLTVDAMKLNPLAICLHRGNFGEPFAQYMEGINRGLIDNPKCTCFVAVTKLVDGNIIGFIGFERIDCEEVEAPTGSLGAQGTVYPPGTDPIAVESWKRETTKMREKFLREHGRYYRTHQLFVSPLVHKTGVGSMLCKHLGERADKEGLPVMVGTTYYTTPFYERFAFLHGYKVTYLDIVTLDADPKMSKLTIHFMMFEKKR